MPEHKIYLGKNTHAIKSRFGVDIAVKNQVVASLTDDMIDKLKSFKDSHNG